MRLKDNNQIIETYLETMLERIGDGNQETREVRQQVESLRAEYEKERAEAKKDPKKEIEFERYQKSLAGALPGITKGTLDAVTAFQQRRRISSSAVRRSSISAQVWPRLWAACRLPAARRAPCSGRCSPWSR